jgi:TLD
MVAGSSPTHGNAVLSLGPSTPQTCQDDLVQESASWIPQTAHSNKKALREKLGFDDWGVALFSPIHEDLLVPPRPSTEIMDPLCRQDKEEKDNKPSLSQRDGLPVELDFSSSSIFEDEGDCHDLPPVRIELPLVQADLLHAPQIISEAMLQQLVQDAVPSSLQVSTTWKRLFSISLHGDCVSSMLNRCALFRHSLIVVKTMCGTILGGFASEPWSARACLDKTRYYGNGSSFLFSSSPQRHDGKLNIYKWVGANDYCQLCDIPAGRIALGGGGNFGLVLQDNFLRGSSGPCATFENPSLVPGRGSFDVVEFEVYGIVPLAQTAHFRQDSLAMLE